MLKFNFYLHEQINITQKKVLKQKQNIWSESVNE